MAATINQLPWLDQQWSNLFASSSNHLLVLTVVSFVIHELAYYGRYIPFLIADQIPALQKYKIQMTKSLSGAEYYKLLVGVLYSHYVIELPMMMLFHPTAQFLGMQVDSVPLPSWTTVFLQTFLFAVIEDAFHYWAHRALHSSKYLYKVVHKQHHEFAAPVGICSEYAHPFEILILSTGTFIGPLAYTAMTGEFHVFTMLVWSVVRTVQAIEAHSGYDFPWSLNKFVPFWSGADHHDFHHQNFTGNYATSFRWWDWAMGTEGNYHVVRARQQLAKAEMFYSSHKRALHKAADGMADSKYFDSVAEDRNECEERVKST